MFNVQQPISHCYILHHSKSLYLHTRVYHCMEKFLCTRIRSIKLVLTYLPAAQLYKQAVLGRWLNICFYIITPIKKWKLQSRNILRFSYFRVWVLLQLLRTSVQLWIIHTQTYTHTYTHINTVGTSGLLAQKYSQQFQKRENEVVLVP